MSTLLESIKKAMEERERTKRQRKKTNVRRRRGTWISRPFGRFADPLASDSSDSDYVPSEDIIPAGKSSGKRKKPFERFSHPAKDESISRRKKVKHGDSCTYVKQILDDAKSERPSLGSFHSSALEQNDSSTAKNFAVWNTIPTEIIVKIFRLVVQESNGIKLLLRCIFKLVDAILTGLFLNAVVSLIFSFTST